MKNKTKIVTLEQNWPVITSKREKQWVQIPPKSNFVTTDFYVSVWEVAYRSRDESKISASPKPSPAQVTAYKTGNLEHTAQPAGSSTAWGMSFLGDSVGLYLFRALIWSTPLQGSSFGLHLFKEEAQLVSVSFLWFLAFKVSASSSCGACFKVFVTCLRSVIFGILCLLWEGRN